MGEAESFFKTSWTPLKKMQMTKRAAGRLRSFLSLILKKKGEEYANGLIHSQEKKRGEKKYIYIY